tara:strand:- start:1814 stop:2617 length:804 start_codon:yes stop_codon:yes gene_type:complete
MLYVIILIVSLIIVWIVLGSIRQTKEQRPILMKTKKQIPVYIYFHVCCLTINEKINWKSIVTYMFDYLEKFDAFSKITEMRICMLGDKKHLEDPIWKRHPNIKIHAHDEDKSSYERFTIHRMRDDALKEDFVCFYMHSKGYRTGMNKSQPWVKEMIRNGWKNFDFIIEELQIYDTIGTRLKFQDGKLGSHYSGNFWWSKSDYLKTRLDNIGPKYYDPEAWIHKQIGARIMGLENGEKVDDMVIQRGQKKKRLYYGTPSNDRNQSEDS